MPGVHPQLGHRGVRGRRDVAAVAARLDPSADAAYGARMDNADVLAQLRAITARVDTLVDRLQQLSAENRSLRQQQEQLASERSQLLAKNEQARSRVEAMIARLKSLEQHT